MTILKPGQERIQVCCMSKPPKKNQSCMIYTKKGKRLLFKKYSEFKDKESDFVEDDDEILGWWPMRLSFGGSSIAGMMPPMIPRMPRKKVD